MLNDCAIFLLRNRKIAQYSYCMDIKTGPPVTGNNFYPRPLLIKRIHQRIRRGHLAFLGPRRTGKTSILNEIFSSPPEGFVPVLLNLEKHDIVAGWLEAMVRAIRVALNKPEPKLAWIKSKGKEFLNRMASIKFPVGEIELNAPMADHAWRLVADDLQALLNESGAPLLFLLDEFPVFLNLVAGKSSREEVEAVLNWFRALRTEPNVSFRFLVTGSIGLKAVVRRLGLAPSINDFDTLEIPPLEESEALELVCCLAKDNAIVLSKKNPGQILRLLGANWPILIQLFVSEIQDANFRTPPTALQLTGLYQSRLVNDGRSNEYCSGMFTRLKVVFTASECRLAREILKQLCASARGLSREEFETIHARLIPDAAQRSLQDDDLENVIEVLKHDGYVLRENEGECRTRFASNILRDYWRFKTT